MRNVSKELWCWSRPPSGLHILQQQNVDCGVKTNASSKKAKQLNNRPNCLIDSGDSRWWFASGKMSIKGLVQLTIHAWRDFRQRPRPREYPRAELGLCRAYARCIRPPCPQTVILQATTNTPLLLRWILLVATCTQHGGEPEMVPTERTSHACPAAYGRSSAMPPPSGSPAAAV